jgi:hypothetical protein
MSDGMTDMMREIEGQKTMDKAAQKYAGLVKQYAARATAAVTPPSDARQLANDHWDKYVGPMLATHGTPSNVLILCEFHYKSAFIHGYKHAVEDGRAVSAAAMANEAASGNGR